MTETICEECRVGRYQPTATTYMQWVGERLIMFPNAPSYTCDVCRHMYYDAYFIHNIEYVVHRLTQPDPLPAAKQSPAGNKTRRWQPSRSSG